ncbi:MAG: type I methionyl aminopeptidase [Armatimonadetes bacterium CG2_30_59_28]|nr:type I methionyl aminopeptidase [Armatimonadota bacterium]OIO90339.1 MAG: type I methionyl aminopeptidase [Armatimonadetes bacterium CG2_30_59_28]PIU62345.1 MAG: type I methionyl aminopeptidase [Armatimonadetes bacterium CG07_land_8_20_14_0_80_59_28]PJB61798.1 MAG: type I methionyl aminopeptidase [Armatimonadetes bacterium CG_4_9_14_3_um_filter_58_7]
MSKIICKNKEQIHLMRRSNHAARKILNRLGESVQPGITTGDLDRRARQLTKEFGGRAAFLGVRGGKGVRPFPAAICASPNKVVVHGIPNGTPLVEGDILGIDYGIVLERYYGDTAWTYPLGAVSENATFLMKIARESLYKGIEQAKPGNRLGEVSYAIQCHVEAHGCGVVRELVGHGIGRSMHEPPQIPNFGAPDEGPKLKPGMTLAIEPMITRGNYEVDCLDDGWTIVTKDSSLSAHFEHTVVVLSDGPEILSVDG